MITAILLNSTLWQLLGQVLSCLEFNSTVIVDFFLFLRKKMLKFNLQLEPKSTQHLDIIVTLVSILSLSSEGPITELDFTFFRFSVNTDFLLLLRWAKQLWRIYWPVSFYFNEFHSHASISSLFVPHFSFPPIHENDRLTSSMAGP